MNLRKHKMRYLAVFILLLLIKTELGLRTYFGFCHEVLMKSNPDFEYINLANQQTQQLEKLPL